MMESSLVEPCLICCNDITTPSSSDYQEDIYVESFILQILFAIPQNHYILNRKCKRPQTKSGSNCSGLENSEVNDNIKLCDQCTKAVDQARSIYSELLEKANAFRTVHEKIIKAVNKSSGLTLSNSSYFVPAKNDKQFFYEEIRRFVVENSIGICKGPLVLKEVTLSSPALPTDTWCEQNNYENHSNHQEYQTLTEIFTSNSPKAANEFIRHKDAIKEELESDSVSTEDGNNDENSKSDYYSPMFDKPMNGNDCLLDKNITVKSEPQSDEESSIATSNDVVSSEEDDDEEIKEDKNDSTSAESDENDGDVKDDDVVVKSKTRRSIIYQNENTNEKAEYKCSRCPRAFKSYKGLVAHERQAHGARMGIKRFKCFEDNCGLGFSSSSNLIAHLQKKHKRKPGIKCDICSEAFYLEKQLMRHVRNVHKPKRTMKVMEEEKRLSGGVQCSICHSWYRKSGIRSHYKRNHKGEKVPQDLTSYPCPHEGCDKVYHNPCNLQVHLSKHVGMPQYQCKICVNAFYSTQQLVRHEQNVHGMDAAFVCEICGEGFRVKHYLQVHRYRYHTDNPKPRPTKKYLPRPPPSEDKNEDKQDSTSPYVCHICGAEFKAPNYLYQHNRFVHLKIFRHQCKHCDKALKSPYDLRKHMRRFHQEFVLLSSLSTQEATDSSAKLYQCQVVGCKTSFLDKVKLECHIRKHHGNSGEDLRYLCTFCGKGFHEKYKFDEHVLTHVNKDTRPVKCDLCGKGFVNRTNMRYHQLNTHKVQRKQARGPGLKSKIQNDNN